MKRREDSFFGLHLDIHADPGTSVDCIGEGLTEEQIRTLCRTVKPDFVQIDCKGHPGYASYPTALGNAFPFIQGDPLALWRRVTAEEGVALAGGRFVFTFADKEHSTGDVKIYPEATGNYKVGIFTRMTKYDEDTGESYDCIQIRMADSTDGKLTFHITGNDTEYVFREDVTDQYRGSYPALEEAARIYRLKKTVG